MPYSPVVDRPIRSLRWRAPILASMLSVGLLGACANGPPPRLYLLEAVNDMALEPQPLPLESLGLSVVNLPDYANDARITSRRDGIEITQDDEHRWAETPEDALTRLLADRLRFFSGARVLVEPWPRGFDPERRLRVDFDRLLREPGGGSSMAGQVQILSSDGRDVLSLLPFAVERPAGDQDPAAFFAATASAMNELAQQTIVALRQQR